MPTKSQISCDYAMKFRAYDIIPINKFSNAYREIWKGIMKMCLKYESIDTFLKYQIEFPAGISIIL